MFIPLVDEISTWDTSKKLVFIDDWFWINHDAEILNKIDYEVLDVDYCDLQISADEIYDFAILLAECVGQILNKYHKTNFSLLYWRRVLFNWFFQFASIVALRYERLRVLVERYPNEEFYANILDETTREWVLLDPIDLEKCELVYGMHIYSVLLRNGDFPVQVKLLKRTTRDMNLLDKIVVGGESKKPFLGERILKSIIYNVKHPREAVEKCYYRGRNLFYKDTKDNVKIVLAWCVSRKLAEKLNVKTNGQIAWFTEDVPVWEKRISEPPVIDSNFRQCAQTQLLLKLNNLKGWKKAVINMVFSELPCCFVENYVRCSAVYRSVFQQYPNLKIILSSPGAFFTESMLALSEQRERGVRFSLMQHGGFPLSKNRVKQFGRVKSDFYYGWGKWGEDIPKDILEYRHSPADKLYWLYGDGIGEIKGNGILYVGDYVHPIKQFLGYHSIGCLYSREKRFIDKLKSPYRTDLIVRNYPNDYGRLLDNLVKVNCPDVRISSVNECSCQQTFSEVLTAAKIVVIDHVETPWLEALYVRKPFIIFFDDDFMDYYFDLDVERPYVDMMKEVGLIQNGPDAAAEYVNKIYPDIDAWWGNKRRQEVLEILRERYTEPYMDVEKWWCAEVRDILKSVDNA